MTMDHMRWPIAEAGTCSPVVDQVCLQPYCIYSYIGSRVLLVFSPPLSPVTGPLQYTQPVHNNALSYSHNEIHTIHNGLNRSGVDPPLSSYIHNGGGGLFWIETSMMELCMAQRLATSAIFLAPDRQSCSRSIRNVGTGNDGGCMLTRACTHWPTGSRNHQQL